MYLIYNLIINKILKKYINNKIIKIIIIRKKIKKR